jgi:hypothetical protein
MAAFHALEDHVVAGLQGQVQIRRQALFLRQAAHQVGVDLGGVDG